MLRRWLLVTGALSFFLSQAAWCNDSGGMSGGGGGLVRDADNPWFLENTASVTYCINIDAKHFKPDITYVRAMVTRALAYWKTEFSDAEAYGIGSDTPPVKIATQNFREVACDQQPDLRFQMGTLTPEQLKAFDDPTLYAGAAIRESYNRVTLKATGFVYVAADSGPLRFAGIAPNIEDFWQLGVGGLLYKTIVHELGHVFGLRHSTGAETIMGVQYIENMMRDFSNYAYGFELGDFFKFRGSWPGTTGAGIDGGPENPLPPATIAYFGLPTGARGMWMEFLSGSDRKIAVTTAVDTVPPFITAGTIELEAKSDQRSPARIQTEAVNIYLPEAQQVFSLPQGYNGKYLPGPMITSYIRKGVYTSANGLIHREVVLFLKPRGPESFIGGVIGGKYVENIMY